MLYKHEKVLQAFLVLVQKAANSDIDISEVKLKASSDTGWLNKSIPET